VAAAVLERGGSKAGSGAARVRLRLRLGNELIGPRVRDVSTMGTSAAARTAGRSAVQGPRRTRPPGRPASSRLKSNASYRAAMLERLRLRHRPSTARATACAMIAIPRKACRRGGQDLQQPVAPTGSTVTQIGSRCRSRGQLRRPSDPAGWGRGSLHVAPTPIRLANYLGVTGTTRTVPGWRCAA
jgi:hypothetical protein